MEQFHPFQRLPEDIRKKIWTHVAYWPRVVGISDVYGSADAEHPEYDHRDEIVIASFTRTPAILGVCCESRNLALTIYKSLDNGNQIRNIEQKNRHTPVYVNPEVDIIYRNKLTCDRGGAFVLRYVDVTGDKDDEWEVLKKPVSGTRILAVDLIALTKPYSLFTLQRVERLFGKDETQWPLGVAAKLKITATTSIADCALAGVREILIVVGNDDDGSEVKLVPLSTDVECMTPREKGAFNEASRIGEELRLHWKRKHEDSDPKYTEQNMPTLRVVTVERKPVTTFPLFQQLPIELQDMVWAFAAYTPRVLTLARDTINYGSEVARIRQPALASVCKSSRRVIMSQTLNQLPGTSQAHFHPPTDTVHLDCVDVYEDDNWREFSKLKIQSLALDWDYARMFFSASDAKLFNGLREIVIIASDSSYDYERTLVTMEENCTLPHPPRPTGEIELYVQSRYVHRLRIELEKLSKKWKSYQRRRVKQGKVSPDWIVPTVRLVHLKALRQVKSPYSYEHESSKVCDGLDRMDDPWTISLDLDNAPRPHFQ